MGALTSHIVFYGISSQLYIGIPSLWLVLSRSKGVQNLKIRIFSRIIIKKVFNYAVLVVRVINY